MFGVWQSPTGPRLIMEKQAAGIKACKKCNGFGNYGIPMCGALYKCDKCNGSGKRLMNKLKAAINATVIILIILLQIVLFSIFPAEAFVGLILTIIIIVSWLEIYKRLQKKEKE